MSYLEHNQYTQLIEAGWYNVLSMLRCCLHKPTSMQQVYTGVNMIYAQLGKVKHDVWVRLSTNKYATFVQYPTYLRHIHGVDSY